MELSIVKAISDYVIKALCTTLIHSLWQGLLLAALAGIIIIGTRKSTPARRYNLLIAALIIFTCTVTFTFVSQLQQEHSYSVVTLGKVSPAANNAVFNNAVQFQVVPTTSKLKFFSFLNDHSYTIVLIWFLIVFARSLQLMTGLHGLYYFRHRNIFAVDEVWEIRVKELAQSLGIKQIVSIAESGMAKVPMVIGHLKPLILIPVGLMTALSTAEIEAILVHELAHIRRKDYLVNMLVSLMEIVFFFNPAVLWISSLIKNERENCCDDIAVAQTSSKINYIKALVSCQEYQLSTPAYAMAINGHKGHLMGRVTRMVSNSNQSLNKIEKSLLALCLVMAGLLTTAFSNADKINKLVDTTTKAVKHIIKKEPVEPLEATEHPDSIAAKPLKTITTIAADTDKKVKADTSAKITIYQPDQVGKGTNLVIGDHNLKTYLAKDDDVLYQVNTNGKVIVSVQVNGTSVTLEQGDIYKQALNQTILKKHVQVAPVAAIAPIARKADPITPIKAIAEPAQPAYQPYNAAYNANYKAQTPYAPKEPKYPAYDAKKADADRDALTQDLIKQGIIKNKEELTSFKLSNTEFIVNYKRVPDDVYGKFKEKYVHMTGNGDWSWFYNYDNEVTVK